MTAVTVYTKPNCKQCDLTKEALAKHGIPFEVDDITTPENLAAAQALGLGSAPVVILDDGTSTPDGIDQAWAGFRPDLIGQLAQRIEGDR